MVIPSVERKQREEQACWEVALVSEKLNLGRWLVPRSIHSELSSGRGQAKLGTGKGVRG